jgi:hypothetical protein
MRTFAWVSKTVHGVGANAHSNSLLFELTDEGCSWMLALGLFGLLRRRIKLSSSCFAGDRPARWVASARRRQCKLVTSRCHVKPESAMNATPQSSDVLRRRVARLSAIASLIALVVMAALTVGALRVGAARNSIITVADTTTSSTPSSIPPVNSAAPLVTAGPFQGGDWLNG